MKLKAKYDAFTQPPAYANPNANLEHQTPNANK